MEDDLSRRLEASLDALAAEVGGVDRKMQDVRDFLREAEGSPFDEAECESARKVLLHLEGTKKELRDRMRAKLDLYENRVLLLKGMIAEREAVIAEYEKRGTLGEHRSLLDAVVKRHADLTRDLEQATADLEL